MGGSGIGVRGRGMWGGSTRTWAEGFRRTTMTLEQEIVRDDDPDRAVTRARVTAVWIGPDRRPMRVPEDVRAGLGWRGGAA